MRVIRRKYDANYFENNAYRAVLNSQRNVARLKEILSRKSCGKLLEIGCAKGEFLALAQGYFDVEGIDISEYAVLHAKNMLGEKVKVADVAKENVKTNYYDVVVGFNVLEHIANPEVALAAVFGSLKKDGFFIGSVPNNFGLIGGLFTRLTNVIDKTHVSTYPLDQWLQVFKKAGFKNNVLFGEVAVSVNHSICIKNIFWKWLSFNMVFICRK